MSCGQIALNRAGIHYDKYYASEIDKYAIKVTQHNYPNTIQLGDVTQIRHTDLPQIDLLMGGSPCQGFSFSGKQLNFNDPRSKLFFEFSRLVQECHPKYWFLENVIMKKEFEHVITDHLGVEPVMINSALVSAQNRKRLYWANFSITQPFDKGLKLTDVLDNIEMIGPGAVRGRRLSKGAIVGRKIDLNGHRQDYSKEIPISQYLEVRAVNRDKSNCLTTVAKDNVLTTLPAGRYLFEKILPYRYYTIREYCKLQTVPENYFEGVSLTDIQIRKMIGNGWTVDVIVHILKGLLDNSSNF
jgi:DNA (cytosine-5)-methyltransferase 3A